MRSRRLLRSTHRLRRRLCSDSTLLPTVASARLLSPAVVSPLPPLRALGRVPPFPPATRHPYSASPHRGAGAMRFPEDKRHTAPCSPVAGAARPGSAGQSHGRGPLPDPDQASLPDWGGGVLGKAGIVPACTALGKQSSTPRAGQSWWWAADPGTSPLLGNRPSPSGSTAPLGIPASPLRR